MQPPSGGCVLKPRLKDYLAKYNLQPPSGGCVLKRDDYVDEMVRKSAATFGWLCVETINSNRPVIFWRAATFGWLCVETFGTKILTYGLKCSHLRVAVC